MDYDRESTRGGDLGRTGSTGGEPGRTASTGMGGSDVSDRERMSRTDQSGATRGSESDFTRGSIDDVGTRAGAYDRKFTDEHGFSGDHDSMGERIGDKLHEGRERVGEKVEEGKERMEGALDSGRNRIADQLERIGGRIEDRARTMEDSGRVQRQASRVAHRTSEALDSGADYLRSHDATEMRDDLEHAIRERPFMSVGLAIGAGFLLARILRD